MSATTWTKTRATRLYRAIKKATSTQEVLDLAAKAFPSDAHTINAIEHRLRRNDLPTPGAIVRANAKPERQKLATPEKQLLEHRLREELREANASREKLLAELLDRDKQIEVFRSMEDVKQLKPIVAGKRVGSKQRRGTPVILCSDWHVEERVDPKTVNGLNSYDLSIADRCIEELATAFEWLHRDSRYDVREAIVAILGDLFSGYIHEELQEGNFLSPVQASAWLLPRIERMLRAIAAKCPSIARFLVVCNDGNHGRITKKIRAATRTANSLEWFLFFNLAQRMRDDSRFEFQIADGAWNYVDVYDKTLGFTHGDNYQYLGGVGGLLIPVRRGLNEDRKYRKVDHVSMGHFHTRLDLTDVSVNGSMIGITPWSMSKHFPPEPRQQSWFLIDSERGKCLSAPIWLPSTATGHANARIELPASSRP